MHRRLASVPAILLVGLCGSAPATAAQPVPTAYTVTDLGTYGDYVNRATVGAMVTGRTSAAMGGFASAASPSTPRVMLSEVRLRARSSVLAERARMLSSGRREQ